MGLLRTIASLAATIGMAAALACSSAAPSSANILVFAATSMTDALEEIRQEFERESGIHVVVSYGGSQLLARQIENGAPADLYIAAGEFPMTELVRNDFTVDGPVNIISNRLVVITRSDTLMLDSLTDLVSERFERVAIADPDMAPAGRYAMESLRYLGLADELADRLVTGSDVRVTTTYVSTGSADAAIVYQTDAQIVPELPLFDVVPVESYSGIVYPAAVIKKSEKKDQANRLLEYLQSGPARSIFRRHGFDPL